MVWFYKPIIIEEYVSNIYQPVITSIASDIHKYWRKKNKKTLGRPAQRKSRPARPRRNFSWAGPGHWAGRPVSRPGTRYNVYSTKVRMMTRNRAYSIGHLLISFITFVKNSGYFMSFVSFCCILLIYFLITYYPFHICQYFTSSTR